ncbi:acyltransferase family protein [Candidatus Allofournierella excrementigallinarum]|uniref:acyltransferase family protein n=1 Tax=Candidatus Allofournierella excrementigallinarum TaxID=2838592 RepID=UPI00374F8495
MSNSRGGYASIDIAKFVAALLVIMLHLAPGLGLFCQLFSRLAVPFFLVCAGYFLFCKMPDGPDGTAILRYLGRVLRLYLVWTALYYIALPILTPPSGREEIAFLTRPAELLWRLVIDGSWSVLWYLLALLWAVLLCWGCLRAGLGAGSTLGVAGIFYLLGLLGQAYSPLLASLLGFEMFQACIEALGGSRNGLFFAFFYVALGLALSRAKPVPLPRALAGLAVSLPLLLAELLLVGRLAQTAGMDSLAPDFYFFTVPVTFFLFSVLLQTGGESRPVHRLLRVMSTLLYCSHILFWKVVGFFCWLLGVPISGAALFAAVLVLSLVFSLVVALAGRKKPLAWLSWLY